MTAGIETIRELMKPGVYSLLEKKSGMLEKALVEAANGQA